MQKIPFQNRFWHEKLLVFRERGGLEEVQAMELPSGVQVKRKEIDEVMKIKSKHENTSKVESANTFSSIQLLKKLKEEIIQKIEGYFENLDYYEDDDEHQRYIDFFREQYDKCEYSYADKYRHIKEIDEDEMTNDMLEIMSLDEDEMTNDMLEIMSLNAMLNIFNSEKKLSKWDVNFFIRELQDDHIYPDDTRDTLIEDFWDLIARKKQYEMLNQVVSSCSWYVDNDPESDIYYHIINILEKILNRFGDTSYLLYHKIGPFLEELADRADYSYNDEETKFTLNKAVKIYDKHYSKVGGEKKQTRRYKRPRWSSQEKEIKEKDLMDNYKFPELVMHALEGFWCDENLEYDIKSIGGQYIIFIDHDGLQAVFPKILKKNEAECRVVSLSEVLDPYLKNDSQKEFKIFNYELFLTPNVMETLVQEFGAEIFEISISAQLEFINFLNRKSPQEIENLKSLLSKSKSPKEKRDKMTLFFSLSDGEEMEKVALELLEKNQNEIIVQFSEIISLIAKTEEFVMQHLQNNEGLDINPNKDKFKKVIFQRGINMLKEAIKLKPKDMELFLRKSKRYHQDVIAWGALINAAVSSDKSRTMSPKLLNELFKDVEIGTIQGGDLIKSQDKSAMMKAENYLQPDKFSLADYKMIVKNLAQAYTRIDPGWLQYLIDNIPRDLSDPKVKFVFLKNMKENKLKGLCKIKSDPDEPGSYYFGTHYVDAEFQGDFGIGNYLQKIAEAQIPKGAKIVATVATANPAMERHIDTHDGIGTGIVFEADKEHSSRELVEFAWNYAGSFASKDQKVFSRELIKSITNGKTDLGTLPNAKNIRVFKLDTSSENNQEFLETARKYFADSYALTRIFYEKKGTEPNLQETYLVFERPEAESKERSIIASSQLLNEKAVNF